jgi:hypothetical protein
LLAGGFRSTTQSGTPGGTIFIDFIIGVCTIFIDFVIGVCIFFIDFIIFVGSVSSGQQDVKGRSDHLRGTLC